MDDLDSFLIFMMLSLCSVFILLCICFWLWGKK